jgi:hypothetical protein
VQRLVNAAAESQGKPLVVLHGISKPGSSTLMGSGPGDSAHQSIDRTAEVDPNAAALADADPAGAGQEGTSF